MSLHLSEDEFAVVKKVAAALGLQVTVADRTAIPWEYLQANLVTQADIARRLEITRTATTTWKKTYADWPAPVLAFAAASPAGLSELYWWPDIQAFCVRHRYRPGRGMPRSGRPPKIR